MQASLLSSNSSKACLAGGHPQTTVLFSGRLPIVELARAQSGGRTSAVALPYERPRARRPVCERLQAYTDHDGGNKDIHEAGERLWSRRRR